MFPVNIDHVPDIVPKVLGDRPEQGGQKLCGQCVVLRWKEILKRHKQMKKKYYYFQSDGFEKLQSSFFFIILIRLLKLHRIQFP